MYKTETLPNGTTVLMNKEHRFGSDALLLSSFARFKPTWSVCDLGTGCGIILLSLVDSGLTGHAVGVELSADACALFQTSIDNNTLSNVSVLQQNIKQFRTQKAFDLVVSNPPYFTSGEVAANPSRAQARHQIECTIGDVCSTASKVLKYGGLFSVCYPASSLAFLFSSLQTYKLEPKRMQFVRKSTQTEPWLVLVESRLGGGTGLSILPDRILPAGSPVTY